jgi:RNA polymerase sigma-70 factor (ECF subfamily)
MPRHEAEDAAQEALLKIFHRAADFDPSRSALAWALGITYHEVRTARRRRQRRREDVAAPMRADVRESPEEAAMRSEAEAILREALGALRPEDAETLRLYARGERAAIATATFRKRVERALGRLRAAWRTSRGPS